jgi:protein-tyrosine phosphatase
MTLTNMNDMTLLFEQMETVRAAVPNFRDLGGYAAGSDGATRAGCLYRSSELSRCGVPQWDALRALGVQTVIDLRDAHEVAESGGELPPDITRVAIEFHPSQLPCAQGASPADTPAPRALSADFMVAMYRDLVRHRRAQFQQVVVQLARAGGGPALLLESIGVNREQVVADYLKSNAAMEAVVAARLAASHGTQASRPAIDVDNAMPLLRADERYIRAALDTVDTEFGGARAYLAAGDDVKPALDALRAWLVGQSE